MVLLINQNEILTLEKMKIRKYSFDELERHICDDKKVYFGTKDHLIRVISSKAARKICDRVNKIHGFKEYRAEIGKKLRPFWDIIEYPKMIEYAQSEKEILDRVISDFHPEDSSVTITGKLLTAEAEQGFMYYHFDCLQNGQVMDLGECSMLIQTQILMIPHIMRDDKEKCEVYVYKDYKTALNKKLIWAMETLYPNQKKWKKKE